MPTYTQTPILKDLSSLAKIQISLLNTFKYSPDIPIVVAYSGGVDSQVILHACYALKKINLLPNPVSVCHVNHGLSVYAERWEDNAKQYCLTYGLPLEIKKVEVNSTPQKSLEALARDARYKALAEHAPNNSWIVTGHHGDDQVETFFLALKRGSGLKGLSAMKPLIPLTIEPSKFIYLSRPLLTITRSEIIEYANNHQLTWVEDESNIDVRFERNFLRHDVIPIIKKRWPSFLSTLLRSTEHIQESQMLLDELAEQDLKACMSEDNRLATKSLLVLSQPRFNNLLRFYIAQKHWLMPSTEQLFQAYQQIISTDGQSAEVKLGEFWLRVFKGEIYLTPALLNLSSWEHEIEHKDEKVDENIILPDSLGTIHFTTSEDLLDDTKDGNIEHKKIQNSDNTGIKSSQCALKYVIDNKCSIKKYSVKAAMNGQKVEIKFSHNNPTCLPDYRNKSRPLKKVLQELSIPPWERKRVPFLYYDGELVAAIGYFVCKNFASINKENTWIIKHTNSPVNT